MESGEARLHVSHTSDVAPVGGFASAQSVPFGEIAWFIPDRQYNPHPPHDESLSTHGTYLYTDRTDMGHRQHYTALHHLSPGLGEYIWRHDDSGDYYIVTNWREGVQSIGNKNHYLYHAPADVARDATVFHQVRDETTRITPHYFWKKTDARKAMVALLKANPQGYLRVIEGRYADIRLYGTVPEKLRDLSGVSEVGVR